MQASVRLVLSMACLFAGIASADSDGYHPAAREHIRMVDGVPWRYTSRLTSVVELNFTFDAGYFLGKIAISKALARIAERYGAEGKPAFRIHKIQSPPDGDRSSVVPDFTLADLLQGEVLVANNLAYLGLGGLGDLRQEALKAAIDSAGRGYLAFHASARSTLELSGGWSWFQDTLQPRNYQGQNSRHLVPVYVHPAEARHIVLQDVLTSNTFPATVPNEIAADGSVILAPNVPVRNMKYRIYEFGRDITQDPAYKDKVTLLLKHDERVLPNLNSQFKRPGGGVHSYLYRVGKGMTAYIPAGHADDEIMNPETGFDGGVGDFDRYVAQLLFFLAGYDRKPCDSTCLSLPIVDGREHIASAPVGSGPLAPKAKAVKSPSSRDVDALGRIGRKAL
jgi:hypothetical protein